MHDAVYLIYFEMSEKKLRAAKSRRRRILNWLTGFEVDIMQIA